MERECMDKLNQYCQRHKFVLSYDDVDRTGPSHVPEFTVAVKINNVEYGRGTGKNKKEAKAIAAKNAWLMIEKQLESPSSNLTAELMTPQVTSSPVPPSTSNYISILNTYSQKSSQVVDYPNKCFGDAHAPMFVCSCTISGHVYGRGTGMTLASAKQAAAKEAFEKLTSEGSLTVCDINSSRLLLPLNRDSEDSAAKLVEKVKDMAVCESPSPSQRGAQGSAPKCQRKLAANFDNARNKEEEKKMSDLDKKFQDLDRNTGEENENPYTVNERFLESFKNIEPIGEGGFGNVFQATAKLDKRTYAVKRVQFTKNVEREVKELARLEHENIVRYYGSWEGYDYVTYPDSRQKSDKKINCLFIQMELCEQGPLENWIEKHREKRKYHEMAHNKFLQILKGVEYIHSKGLIHRDLKPQNILLSHEDKIKIGDFGLVTSVEYETLTENRGTKSYMAPEQARDSYGNKVDIYALGLIWFELLLACSRHEKVTIWPDVREGRFPEYFTKQFPAEAPIIKKMLSRDPSVRYPASEILKFLKSVNNDNSLKTHT
ncbi:Interferon-induced, double-stranded RNA-activated protein kinase, partial [Merops nubicus]